MADACCICGREGGTGEAELRPYGPGGRPICWSCATIPEREADTLAEYKKRLDAISGKPGTIVVIGGSEGPVAVPLPAPQKGRAS
jgi:hypothetical protein